jgi:uncharacterized protein (TIGR02266 family)
MSYSGAVQAREAREALGKALEALQEDANIPQDVLAVAQNIAQSVGALFEAERASTEPDGKACIRSALGSLTQTLTLLQDVREEHRGIAVATEVIARAMSSLYPLTTRPTKAPPPMYGTPPSSPPADAIPLVRPARSAAVPGHAAPQPHHGIPAQGAPGYPQQPVAPQGYSQPGVAPAGQRVHAEANIGATTESNFFVGFSGEVAEGGVFLATYETFPQGTPIDLLVTLPGGFEMRVAGRVRFVRDPMDFGADSEPGMGIQFDQLSPENRELVLRFIRKRPPMFYDD